MKILQGGPAGPGRKRLGAKERQAAVARCQAVRRQGDRALAKGRSGRALAVDRRSFRQAFRRLTPQTRAALELACSHVGNLARRELAALKEFDLKPTAGVTLYQRLLPVQSAGMLVPARQVSTLLACAIPAAVAGVARRVVCVEPSPGAGPGEGAEGEVDPHLLAAAYMCDVTELYAVGGVDGLAALAHGTQTIAAVDRIGGQGDAAVVAARAELSEVCDVTGVMGSTELVVLADDTAAPEFVAADLMAQAEADPQGSCLLVTPSEALAEATRDRLRKRQRALAAKHPARGPLRRAQGVVVGSLVAAVELANQRVPQWLSLQVKRPDELVGRLCGYGTLLVGPHTTVALARRVTGASSLLPPGAAPRWESPWSVADFLRRVTVQQVDPSAYLRLSRAATTLASLEGADLAAEAIAERIGRPSDE